MKKAFTFIMCAAAAFASSAQTAQIITATKQGWSGGICCATGTDYHVKLMIISSKKIRLDTLWVDGHAFRLFTDDKHGSYQNTMVEIKHDTSFYSISAGISWNGHSEYNIDTSLVNGKKILPPQYPGADCIIYKAGGRRETADIEKFSELPPIAYP